MKYACAWNQWCPFFLKGEAPRSASHRRCPRRGGGTHRKVGGHRSLGHLGHRKYRPGVKKGHFTHFWPQKWDGGKSSAPRVPPTFLATVLRCSEMHSEQFMPNLAKSWIHSLHEYIWLEYLIVKVSESCILSLTVFVIEFYKDVSVILIQPNSRILEIFHPILYLLMMG